LNMAQEGFNHIKQSKIQLFSRIKLKSVVPGERESIYTGDGIEFSTIKPLEPGDDLRDLNLVTLVQSGEEEIIQRVAGRQMPIFICADLSGSMLRFKDMFLSSKPDIRDIGVGMLIYSAFNSYSPVGLCAFADEIRWFLPARYGEVFCDDILKKIKEQDYKGATAPADVQKAIACLMQRVPNQSMVFFVSDFKEPIFEEDFTGLLRTVAKKFDFIPVVIMDPIERYAFLTKPVNVIVRDSEGGGMAEIYLTPQKVKEMQEISARHLEHLAYNFRNAGLEYFVLDSPSINDCFRVISDFFDARRRTRV
jgi:uncharacterized protein (DUF58 family)